MLTDDIKKTIKQLKQLDVLESVVQDAEKKAKNDSDFSSLVEDFSVSMSKLSFASKELEYSLTDETLQLIDEAIEKLENVISAGVVDEEELFTTKQHINRKVNPGLSKEWKVFHHQKTSVVAAKLATIGSLVLDKDKITSIRTNITNGNDWTGLSLKDDGKNTRIQLLKSSISEVDQIEEKLNLSPEIKDFVVLVTRGKAKVTDINSNIIDWIQKENLEEKFVVSFKNS